MVRVYSSSKMASGAAMIPPMGGNSSVPSTPASKATIIVVQEAPPLRAPAPITGYPQGTMSIKMVMITNKIMPSVWNR